LEQQLNQLNQQEQHHQHEEVKMNEKYLAMIDLHETLEQQNVNMSETISTLENNLNQTKDRSGPISNKSTSTSRNWQGYGNECWNKKSAVLVC
jgi:hypothetical protein